MKLIKDEKGVSAVEYALLTLATLGFLLMIVNSVHSNIFSNYLDKVTQTFLIQSPHKLNDITGLITKLGRY